MYTQLCQLLCQKASVHTAVLVLNEFVYTAMIRSMRVHTLPSASLQLAKLEPQWPPDQVGGADSALDAAGALLAASNLSAVRGTGYGVAPLWCRIDF